MNHTRARPRSNRRRPPPRRLSGVALYLLFLNIVSFGIVIAIYWPSAEQSVTDTVLPTAHVIENAPNTGIVASLPVLSVPQQVPIITPTATGPLQAGPVPILMYHYIRTVDPNADPIGFGLSVAPDMFDQHLAWLRDNGYTTISMALAQRCIQGEPVCPPNAIALTFDDGYADAFSAALPVLQKYGFIATFYLVNNFVGQPGYVTWEQAQALHAAGMEIGAHTLDHLDLTTLDPAEARRQIEQSKLDIEARLGFAVSSFCYPAGRYNGDIASLVRESGYGNATTTRWDADYSDMFGLPRRRIEGGKGLDVFAAVVNG